MKTALILLFCLALMFIMTFGAFIWMPASIHYRITERYILTTSDEKVSVYLGIMLPKSGPYQQIKNINISWLGDVNREYAGCVELVKLNKNIEPYSQDKAVIEYLASVSSGLVLWHDESNDCQLPNPVQSELEHPVIKKQASMITDGNSILDAYRIFSFTSQYIVHKSEPLACSRASSAYEAYISGVGTCCEFSRLMVGLAHAAGIPARSISGVLMPDLELPGEMITSEDSHPGEAHAWVELAQGDLWTMADPTWGSEGWQLTSFGRNDGRHLRYGDAKVEAEIYQELRSWAAAYTPLSAKRFAGLKYVLAAIPKDIQMKVVVSVQKGWDGRWLNAILVLVISTYLACRVRNCLLNASSTSLF